MKNHKEVERNVNHTILTDKASPAVGPYSAGWRAGDFIFVAGQGPYDPVTGELAGSDIDAQTTQTLKNIGAVLEAEGATTANIIMVDVFLRNAADFAGMNNAYRKFFSEPFPGRATVVTGLVLEGMLVEMKAIAYVGK